MSGWIIAIPSYNRVNTLKEKTLAVLKQYKIPASKIHIFVANEEEKKKYEEGLEKGSYGHLTVAIKGLPEARNFIFKSFPKGQEIVEMDDDIRGFVEYTPRTKRHERPLQDLAGLFDRGFAECKKAGARLWGLYPVPNGFFMKPTVTTDLKFIIGSTWGCINPGEEIQLDLGGEKEDYRRTILFWEADGVVVRLNFVAPKTAYYKEPGGLQDGDRKAREEKTVKTMLKRWPQYIKLNPRRKSGYTEIKLYNGTKANRVTRKRSKEHT